MFLKISRLVRYRYHSKEEITGRRDFKKSEAYHTIQNWSPISGNRLRIRQQRTPPRDKRRRQTAKPAGRGFLRRIHPRGRPALARRTRPPDDEVQEGQSEHWTRRIQPALPGRTRPPQQTPARKRIRLKWHCFLWPKRIKHVNFKLKFELQRTRSQLYHVISKLKTDINNTERCRTSDGSLPDQPSLSC